MTKEMFASLKNLPQSPSGLASSPRGEVGLSRSGLRGGGQPYRRIFRGSKRIVFKPRPGEATKPKTRLSPSGETAPKPPKPDRVFSRGQKNKSSTFQQGIKSRWKNLTGAPSSPQQATGYSGKVLDKPGEGVLKIIPLGGCEEVGRNMTVFEYGEDIVILDMGLQFPEEDMPGIDYIIPNINYLRGKEKNIRGVILSHG
ncbi:hypothetical protein HZA71_00440, partial [Candidatus Falkowbacteria bacterium]|nr:hypothetical protein [Candidatus Falkowbacteria bacterium]